MLDQQESEFLIQILHANNVWPSPLKALEFRAANHQQLTAIKDLVANQWIYEQNDNYYVSIFILAELAKIDAIARDLLIDCDFLFNAMKQCYLANPGESVEFQKVVLTADLPITDCYKAFQFIQELPILQSWSANADFEITSVVIKEAIIEAKSFGDLLRKTTEVRNRLQSNSEREFVHSKRLEALKDIRSNEFDLKRLIKICEELNFNFENKNYFSVAALLSMVLDHFPPIFGKKSFNDAANNIGEESVKKSLLDLEQISNQETLLDGISENYSHALDILLAEICRQQES